MIKSVAVGSASVAPEIVPIGTRIFVCVGLHVRVGSIVSGIFVSGIVVCLGTFVGVGIKSSRPKIIEIRLKNGGIINCIVIRDGNIVVGGFNVIIVVRFLDSIIVRFGRIKNIFGKVFIFVGRFDIFFKKFFNRCVRSSFEKWDSAFDQRLAFLLRHGFDCRDDCIGHGNYGPLVSGQAFSSDERHKKIVALGVSSRVQHDGHQEIFAKIGTRYDWIQGARKPSPNSTILG